MLRTDLSKFNTQKTPPLYDIIKDEYKTLIAHTQGNDVSYLLKNYRMSESILRKEDRAKCAKPVTKGIFQTFIDRVMYALVNESLLLPTQETTTDPTTGQEIQKEIPPRIEISANSQIIDYANNNLTCQTIKGYLQIWQKKIGYQTFNDANGYLIAFPTGEGLNTPSVPVDVTLKVVNYVNVVIDEIDYIVYKDGDFYYEINTVSFERFYKQGNKFIQDDWSYTHNLGYLPCIKLGGDWRESDDEILQNDYYSSYLHPAIVNANLAVEKFTDIELIDILHTHPFLVMPEEPCSNKYCNNGIDSSLKTKNQTCLTCNGTGRINANLSLGTVIYRKKNEEFKDDKPFENIPVLEFIAPDISALQFKYERYKEILQAVKDDLQLLTVLEAQSGYAKAVDMAQGEPKIMKIAKNFWRQIEFTMQVIKDLRKIQGEPIKIKLSNNFVKLTTNI